MRPETIETDRVRLRRYQETDIADLMAGCGDPLTRRFLPALPDPYTEIDARWWIADGSGAEWAAGGAAYAIADPGSDRLLGGIGIGNVQRLRGQGEVGYWVAPWARRQGVATAAVTALVDRAFATGFTRLELLTHLDNGPSQRVALAAGFQREGVRRGAGPGRGGGRRDLLGWARLAGDPAGPTPRTLPDLPGGRLTDGVVVLRPLAAADTDFLFALQRLPEVVATSVPPLAPERSAIAAKCAGAESSWLAGSRADLVILDAASGEPAGEIGLYYQEPPTGQAMIGYAMLPAWRGRGYPTRAARLLARWAFDATGIARLIAGTLPENTGSQRVLEKAGFQREGHLRGRLPGIAGTRVDDILYALLPTDLPG
ncbi:GNAT family N-acetyltransferase [Solwaraspora sp. WMMD1047]|uniref:GNAT family N-acetyltransferase n=1 Tax=Solwaraspora sp. WMMD1047 TaxID=3016102 RepID=UPI002416A37D|nr:GNAT family N-acetyltransferase [Solwaraspora sp. WMMD1047]MDG4833077.1 GNAT family N-acetyltransferase [Solwaraspora sp. WMMD1047]